MTASVADAFGCVADPMLLQTTCIGSPELVDVEGAEVPQVDQQTAGMRHWALGVRSALHAVRFSGEIRRVRAGNRFV